MHRLGQTAAETGAILLYIRTYVRLHCIHTHCTEEESTSSTVRSVSGTDRAVVAQQPACSEQCKDD